MKGWRRKLCERARRRMERRRVVVVGDVARMQGFWKRISRLKRKLGC